MLIYYQRILEMDEQRASLIQSIINAKILVGTSIIF